MAIFIQDKHQSLDQELWRRYEQGRIASSFDEHRNPNGGSRARKGKLTDTDGTAEERRMSLVRSG